MNMLAPQEHRQPRTGSANDAASPAPANEIKYREDVANYVSAMVAELRQIAAKAGFDRLVTALDSAYYEAYGAVDSKARATTPLPEEKISQPLEPKASGAR